MRSCEACVTLYTIESGYNCIWCARDGCTSWHDSHGGLWGEKGCGLFQSDAMLIENCPDVQTYASFEIAIISITLTAFVVSLIIALSYWKRPTKVPHISIY
jgi:hypothetical protein